MEPFLEDQGHMPGYRGEGGLKKGGTGGQRSGVLADSFEGEKRAFPSTEKKWGGT